jgi:hypothetical protein
MLFRSRLFLCFILFLLSLSLCLFLSLSLTIFLFLLCTSVPRRAAAKEQLDAGALGLLHVVVGGSGV